MSILNLTFNTETKELEVMVDGQKLEHVMDVNIMKYCGDDVSCRICMHEKPEDKMGFTKVTHLVAKDAEFSKLDRGADVGGALKWYMNKKR